MPAASESLRSKYTREIGEKLPHVEGEGPRRSESRSCEDTGLQPS